MPVGKFEDESRLRERYPVGVLHHSERAEFVASLQAMGDKAREAAHG